MGGVRRLAIAVLLLGACATHPPTPRQRERRATDGFDRQDAAISASGRSWYCASDLDHGGSLCERTIEECYRQRDPQAAKMQKWSPCEPSNAAYCFGAPGLTSDVCARTVAHCNDLRDAHLMVMARAEGTPGSPCARR